MNEIEPECVIVVWDRARGFTWDRFDEHGRMKRATPRRGQRLYQHARGPGDDRQAGARQSCGKAVFVFLDPHDVFDDPTDGPVCRRVVKTMINELQLSRPKNKETGDAGPPSADHLPGAGADPPRAASSTSCRSTILGRPSRSTRRRSRASRTVPTARSARTTPGRPWPPSASA